VSETAPEGYYVYQPDPPRPDGRIYAIGGLPYEAICKRLTREEAEVCVAALNKHRQVGKGETAT
jgi:hypothetical protein